MSRDLFADSVCRAPGARFRRTLTFYSVALHVIAISSIVVTQAIAPDALPAIRGALTFQDVQMIKVADIPSPPPPRAATHSEQPTVSSTAAPPVAPDRIIEETGREGVHYERSVTGPVVGEVGIGGLQPLGTVVGVPLAPAEPPAPQKPIRLHAGMRAPVKTVDVTPVYPQLAQASHVGGVVILEAVIDRNGVVESVRVLRSIPLLDKAAVDAVRRWRFTPARLNDEAVPVVMTVTVNFELNK